MSTYKTPIRIHINSTRKVNQRVTKYRLPFKKDEPSPDKQYSLSQLQNQTFKIQAHPKKNNDKGDSITLSRYQQKYGKGFQKQEEDRKQRSIKEELDLQNNIVSSETEQKTPQVLKGEKSASKNNKNSIEQSQQSSRSHSRNNLQRISSIKPRIFHEEPQEQQRYHSAVSQYEEQINLANRSLQSDQEVTYQDTRKPRLPTSERKDETETPLPLIRQQQRRVLHSSLKKDQCKSIWNTLSDEIQEYRSQTIKKQQKRKRRSSQFKMSKQLSRLSSSDNECLAIESELKMLNKNQNNLNLQSKQDFYVNLPAIPEDSHEQQKLKKKQRGIIERLKMDIQLQEQNKKSKLKYPLEHYIENYYKIRQVNPFFRKLNELGGCIILSIGKLKVYESGHQVYTEGQPLTHIYLNVVGKIFLTNMHKSFKKFALTGQTLGEQALFEEGKPYHDRIQRGSRPMFHKEEARTISRVCLLRIKLKKYYKMANQLYSIGYKNMFNLIDNLFRINYNKKQSLRQGLKKDRLQTQILLSRNNHPSPNFFY